MMETKVVNEIELSNRAPLSDEDREDIKILLIDAIAQLGSATAVATRCGVSSAALSQILSGTYATKGDDMWRKIANGLNWTNARWVFARDTTNARIIHKVLEDAHRESMFIAIAERAGSSKSSSIRDYVSNDLTKNVFHITCGRWSSREFYTAMRTALGQPTYKGVFTNNDLMESVIAYFKKRKGRPLVILDQANSLQAHALTSVIYLFNELEDRLGLVLSGTENLKQRISSGIRRKQEGFDELNDRLAQTYVNLVGYLYSDVKKICSANGIKDEATMKKIWSECAPETKDIESAGQSQEIAVVASGRVIKRKILKYRMLSGQGTNTLFTAKTA